MKEILCESCCHWVDCGEKDGKPYGFCLNLDLFTYTAKTACAEYDEGKPVTEEEFDS
jgi:hypothetical protein